MVRVSGVDAISKYLNDWAQPEISIVDSLREHLGRYSHSLVIPAHRESCEQLCQVWQNLPCDFLAIIVVNAATPEPVTRLLYEQLGGRCAQTVVTGTGFCLVPTAADEPDLLLIDRFSTNLCIDPKQGVGLARKIGMDIALYLFATGCVGSAWLCTTDADSILPDDYFIRKTTSGDAAEILPFVHSPARDHVTDEMNNADLQLPTLLYEVRLLYYAASLMWADSPYGFTTLGSTIVCQAVAYAKVRGVPRRNTGEDFYLLNKLRKVGTISTHWRDPVEIEARLSDRVPVGTGPALHRLKMLKDPLADYGYYDPRTFYALKELLDFFKILVLSPGKSTPDSLAPYLAASGLADLLERRRHGTASISGKFLHDWFDAKRTLLFVHFQREHADNAAKSPWPDIPLGDLDLGYLGWNSVCRNETDALRLREHLTHLVFPIA